MSAARCRFLLESVVDLQTRLRARGSDLLVERGHPEDAIPALAASLGSGTTSVTIYAHTDVCSEEGDVTAAVKSALAGKAGGSGSGGPVSVKEVWGNTLHDVSDLPFEFPSGLPRVFTPVGWRKHLARFYGPLFWFVLLRDPEACRRLSIFYFGECILQ